MKKIPTAIGGLSLSIGSLFWLLDNIFEMNNILFCIGTILASVILIPVVLKYLLNPIKLKEDLIHPTLGSIIPTIAMSLMVISKSLSNEGLRIGEYLWFFSICLHLLFLLFFIKGRFNHFQIEHVIPSWFVPPIGIVVAVTTLPTLEFKLIAEIIFWFGFSSYIVMLPFMLKRYFFEKEIHNSLLANTGIMAAPASLCLTGYLSLFENPNFFIVNILFGIALLMTTTVYLFMVKIIRTDFNYGFSALTFPLVISATGLRLYLKWSEKFIEDQFIMKIILNIEVIMAATIVFYVFFRYLNQLKKEYKEKPFTLN